MTSPVFTRKEKTPLTFSEDNYFTDLGQKVILLEDTLQLGEDESGVLDKKLDPDLLHTVGQAIEYLHRPEYREEAERKLAMQHDPDVAVAILRQSFRIRNEQVTQLLIRKLSDLCKSDESGIAKEAIREATGSELQRLSQLTDEVFLEIGTPAELQQVAEDSHRTLQIRIRACHLLIKRDREVEAVRIALEIISEVANKRDKVRKRLFVELHKLLFDLFGAFGSLLIHDDGTIQEEVVEPLLEILRRFQRAQDTRRYLLKAVEELHKPVLDRVRDMPTWEIEGRDMWLVLALRRCAFESESAAKLMIDWMGDWEVNDFFRVRLSRRIKDDRVNFPTTAEKDLRALLQKLPSQHEQEMRENIQEAINAINKDTSSPAEIYDKILKEHRSQTRVDDEVLWDFRHTRGSMRYLSRRVNSAGQKELTLILNIIGHKRFKGRWRRRISIVLDIYTRLSRQEKQESLRILDRLARNTPRKSSPRQETIDFLVDIAKSGSEQSELARQIWQQLAQ
jgi:hypothetical protein